MRGKKTEGASVDITRKPAVSSAQMLQHKDLRKTRGLLVFLICFLVAAFLIALALGRYQVPVIETIKILLSRIIPIPVSWESQMENVVLNIRFPRLCGAVLVGGALSLSGATYQGMFKNPLVSPDLLGVAAGACVGAAASILMHQGAWVTQGLALIGGLLAVCLTVTIPKLFRNNSTLMLVLAGVVVSGFMNSILGLFKYVADPESELASIVYWTMGSLANLKNIDVMVMAPLMIGAGVIILLLRWRVNLLSLGESEAHSLGMNVTRMRWIMILCSTILTASAVCMSGTINWIGLIIPHLGRLLVGQDNKFLLPASVLLGSSFMVVVDTLARNLTGSEIPLSILTGIIGAPLFVWLLIRQKARLG